MILVANIAVEFVKFLFMLLCAQKFHCAWRFCVHGEMERNEEISGLLYVLAQCHFGVLFKYGCVASLSDIVV